MNIKKGDTVKIIAGKDRGKSGKVVRVFSELNKISIEGINLYKKHVRPKKQGERGETVNLSRPLHASNVMIVCGSCGKETRIGNRMDGDRKTRYCKKCKAAL